MVSFAQWNSTLPQPFFPSFEWGGILFWTVLGVAFLIVFIGILVYNWIRKSEEVKNLQQTRTEGNKK